MHIETRDNGHNHVERHEVRSDTGFPEFMAEVARIANLRFNQGPSFMHPDAEWQKVTISVMNGDLEYNRIEIT